MERFLIVLLALSVVGILGACVGTGSLHCTGQSSCLVEVPYVPSVIQGTLVPVLLMLLPFISLSLLYLDRETPVFVLPCNPFDRILRSPRHLIN
ncbi:MAG: hypothetical protein ABEK50_18795 [bacterium]